MYTKVVPCACILVLAWLLGCGDEPQGSDFRADPDAAVGPGVGGSGGTGGSELAVGQGGAGGHGRASGTSPDASGVGGTGSGRRGDAGGPDAGGFANRPDAGPRTSAFPPVDNLGQVGPYTSTTTGNVGPDPGYTVYHPEGLAPSGVKNPIVGWMSGGATDHTLYTLLPHLASHGFVVVAANTVPGIGQEMQLGPQIIAGIDWILAENERADSTFFNALDPDRIASAGYSMGSLSTFVIADEPRLTTTVHISGAT